MIDTQLKGVQELRSLLITWRVTCELDPKQWFLQCTQIDVEAKANMKYVKTYCWAHGTYDLEDRSKHIDYYQWIPILFALQVNQTHNHGKIKNIL